MAWITVLVLASVVLWGLIRMRRRVFRETLRRAVTRGTTGMLMIDLNGFEPADEFARLLRREVGSPGLTARLGDGRFAVVLPGIGSPEPAYEVAGRLAASVAPVIVAGRLVPMTVSIGVSVSGPGELSPGELIRRASVAMEKAREFAPQTRWAAWRESYEKGAGVALAA
jgi:GGDEF domain-containing protein